jgi:hypothetical protein
MKFLFFCSKYAKILNNMKYVQLIAKNRVLLGAKKWDINITVFTFNVK